MKRLLLLLLLATPLLRADYRDDVGFTKLKNEYALPSTENVRLLQVEYIRNGAWAPGGSGASAKVFNYVVGRSVAPSPTGPFSDHANQVVGYLAGPTSMTPELAGWSTSEAVAFGYPGNLNAGRTLAPITATWDVENHSWGGNDALWSPQILARQDLRIERDGVVSIVGVDNGSTMSQMLANGYNSIAVGVSNGNHPHTGTSQVAVGRMKPDLVAPADYTSYATPMVTSAAMILVAETARAPSLAHARSPLVIKALLLAGATKSQFPAWSHSPSHPLDNVYGAGQLNIYNAYKILECGLHAAGDVPLSGWDLGSGSKSSKRYAFTVPSGQKMTLSAVLAWYRHEAPNALFTTWTPTIANLDLKLWQGAALVDVSSSTIDNVEHIYHQLSAGQYSLEVVSDTESEPYALAWSGELTDDTGVTTVVVPPTSTTPTPVQPVTTAAPKVNKFYASNAWSGLTTPTTVVWDGTGASAILTDSSGVQMQVPPAGSITINTPSDRKDPYSSFSDWYLTEIAVNGTQSATSHMVLNGKFSPAQIAAVTTGPAATPTPLLPSLIPTNNPTVTPQPTIAPAATPTPLPIPTLAPTPFPTPTIIPVATPTPTPISVTTVSLPKINSFGHWNSAWAGPSTPSTLYWITTGATSVMITDSSGTTVSEPASGTVIVNKPGGNPFTLTAENDAGQVTAQDPTHGSF